MTVVDIIILSKADNDSLFQMNLNCINSLLESENKDVIKFNIVLIESNKKASYKYPKTQIIVPDEQFGYNRFLNIGIKYCRGDYHAFCNNDLIFHKGWMTAVLEFSKQYPDCMSFSPIDCKYPTMKEVAEGKHSNWGYMIKYQIAGWCIVVKKEIFNHINCLFDSKFDFYFADNDYGLTLLKNNVKHSLISNSIVDHLHGQSTSIEDKKNYLLELSEGSYPKYLFKEEYEWITTNYRMLHDYLLFYNKWGSSKSLYWKYKLFKKFVFLRHKWITKIVYSIRFSVTLLIVC